MHQTNNQLARPYLEKIASHWSRLKFKTAKQAMDYILHPPEKKSNKQNNNFQRKGSSEIIPEWFKERKQQAKQPEKKQDEQLSEQEKRADRKSTRLNSSHVAISYAVFCLKKKTNEREHKSV